VDLQSPQSPQEKIVDFLSGPLLIGIGLALVIGGPLVGRKSDPESNGAKFSWSLFGLQVVCLVQSYVSSGYYHLSSGALKCS